MHYSAPLTVLALLLVHGPRGVQSFSPNACSHQRRAASGVMTTITCLHATTEDSTTQKTKLSRPERKKLERKKKQKRKNGKKKPEVKYTLHSNNISELTPSSNADDVMKAIKR